MAIGYFKILDKQGPSYLQNFIKIKKMPYSFKYTNTAILLNNIWSKISAKIWNSLPKPLKNITSFNQFITNISSWYGNCCNCGACR